MEVKAGNATVRLIKGDLTDQEVDAIVNAANSTLLGGGGVDGAIHSKGGPKILEECRQIRAKEWPDGLPTGNAVITTGGNLKAKYVIHTVGPVWRGGLYEEAKLLRRAYWNSLKLATVKGLKTVAFPSISTGAYGYPTEEASSVAVGTIKDFLTKEDQLDLVMVVLFSERDFEIYLRTAQSLL
ncbi:MAG: O-acetyl-ADP-ribose deacetylase [Nitrososphaerota archaeon]|jgi:O-acetyl-ADP-ribose deacetylase (regulator of RNase III)|uniref:O-acetyl-ADP-ribose deacetylase n=1 Tax=Candidatus Bathycorpusculum sp. TaxID=2994959 RepID=UPI00281C9700|nr:O-acetyl-ADP-ribose deacetylase [Candidatus Termitimicrobium sp.]MDR0493509.1 O-acetyl-ADP-ribose deacetylase [Nitrososphaerota archaeon]